MSKLIVFQGDSITDCGRSRENHSHQGSGYARLISAELSYRYPQEYSFFNRGISGSRIVDLWSRIRMHMIHLHPAYLSILIGVNDVWHEYTDQNGVSAEKFEMIYSHIIEELKAETPETQIILMEPFVLKGSKTESNEEHPDRWEYFRKEVELRAQATARVAEKYNLPFVPLQAVLDAADAQHPGHWTMDGVHPTAFGHELIKRQWLKTFGEIQ